MQIGASSSMGGTANHLLTGSSFESVVAAKAAIQETMKELIVAPSACMVYKTQAQGYSHYDPGAVTA